MKRWRFILSVYLAMFLSACPSTTPDPEPSGPPRIEFSIDGGPTIGYEYGPNDLVTMDVPGTPFITIDDVTTENVLYLYASLATDGFGTNGASDYILFQYASNPQTSYSGTLDQIDISIRSQGNSYTTAVLTNTLVLDSTVNQAPSRELITGTFSGSIRDGTGGDHTISGLFVLENMSAEPPFGS